MGAPLGNAVKCWCGLAGPAAYEIYLRVRTGIWNAWASANQVGWGLHTVTPVQALKDTYWVAFQHVFVAGVAFEYQLEIAVEAVMVLAAFGISAPLAAVMALLFLAGQWTG
jgi:hypothetical protein